MEDVWTMLKKACDKAELPHKCYRHARKALVPHKSNGSTFFTFAKHPKRDALQGYISVVRYLKQRQQNRADNKDIDSKESDEECAIDLTDGDTEEGVGRHQDTKNEDTAAEDVGRHAGLYMMVDRAVQSAISRAFADSLAELQLYRKTCARVSDAVYTAFFDN